jgi:hypothetical protein
LCTARASRVESAAVVVARRGNNASARFSSVRRRAIPDARSAFCALLAHRAVFLLASLAAMFASSPLSSSLGSVLWWAGEPSVRWR